MFFWIMVILGLVIGVPLAVVVVIYLIVPVAKFIGLVFRNIFRFIGHTFTDLLRLIGSLATAMVFAVMSISCVVFRRPSSGHYWEAVGDELAAAGGCLYRLLVGNLVRLFGLQALTERIERRVPQVFEEAPASEQEAAARSAARRGQFEGYQIVGTLQGGGSGGRLYVGRPDAAKLAALHKEHPEPIGDVVIKSFSVHEGSSLPQIVRESRALEAARRLGLVLDHELTSERFFYVMRFVPGESLARLTPMLHAACGPEGLRGAELTRAVSYACDLVATLDGYHRHGLWHKDIKPDNIIVSGGSTEGQPGRAYLVDFGLITPLRSSMTLTTHGTEYFRDPEMVRQALRGVKVHEIDGVKFDIYGAGSVLFSVIENSFPAHGNLSQLTKACPEALRWIVRRAMADYEKRYPTAEMMLADLRRVLAACETTTAQTLKAAELPSLSGEPAPTPPSAEAFVPVPIVAARVGTGGVTGAEMATARPAMSMAGGGLGGVGAAASARGSPAPPIRPVPESRKRKSTAWRDLGIGLAVVAIAGAALLVFGTVGLLFGLSRSQGTVTVSAQLPVRAVVADPPELKGVTSLTALGDKFFGAASSRMNAEQIEKIRRILEEADEKWATERALAARTAMGMLSPEELRDAADGAKVLVIRERGVISGAPARQIDRLSKLMSEHGFEVWDIDDLNHPVNTRVGARELLRAVGARFNGEEQNVEYMRSWMSEDSDDTPRPDMVVWMGPGSDGKLKAWIIPAEHCSEQAARAAELLLDQRTEGTPRR